MRMYLRHGIMCILVAPCICIAESNAHLSRGVEAYLHVRRSRYFGVPISTHLEKEVHTFRRTYPGVYAELSELTNQARTPGAEYMPTPWIPRYIDPVAELFSRWLGWHDAILDALRPAYDTQATHFHEQNVTAYLDAVSAYIHDRYDIASHAIADILANLITRLEIQQVYDFPYYHNLFVHIMPRITRDDITYILNRIRQEHPSQFAEKKELLLSLLTHYAYTKLAVHAIAYDIETNTTQHEKAP